MAPRKIHLEIVTPDRQLFSGEVDEVTVPGVEGALGILPGHAALLSELKTGVIHFREDGKETVLYCEWGFAEVLPHQVSVLAERAESPRQIDVEKAERDRDDAMEQLRSKDPSTDYQAALGRLERATTQLEVSRLG